MISGLVALPCPTQNLGILLIPKVQGIGCGSRIGRKSWPAVGVYTEYTDIYIYTQGSVGLYIGRERVCRMSG